MSYLYDKQITPEEMEKLSKYCAELLKRMVMINLETKLKEELIKKLSLNVEGVDSLRLHYSVDVGIGVISAELGRIRLEEAKKNKGKKK
jgi:hypothetical protein